MESSVQIEEAAAIWLAKRDGGNWTDADQAEFTQWLHASTGNRVAFVRLDAAWKQASRLKAVGAGVRPGVVPPPGKWGHSRFFDKHLRMSASGVAESSQKPAARGFSHSYRALAASVILGAALGAAWFLWPTGPTHRTPVGGLAAVPMADGSRVTLNTDSEIRVAVTETERRVELDQGEAFFEVVKDPTRPFVVRVGDKRVVAVGTKFSVRREADRVRVVVTEGRVRVESTASGLGGAAILPAEVSAGSIARSGDAGVLIQEKSLAETEEILSWRSGYLIFKDATLADAVAEFNRYNTNKIVIKDAAVAGIRIGGNFRSTNVEAFVRLLEDGFPIRVDQRDNRIVLTKN